MARTNYSYQKRQRELAKKKKKEEKRKKREALKDQPAEGSAGSAEHVNDPNEEAENDRSGA